MNAKRVDPTQKVQDNVISSITRLYLLLLSFSFLYSYVALGHLSYNADLRALAALDGLQAIRAAARNKLQAPETLNYSDLPRFFDNAAAEFAQFVSPSGRLLNEEELRRLFPSSAAPGAQLFPDVPMPTRRRASCSMALFSIAPGHRFDFATFMDVGRIFFVKSEDITLLALDRDCTIGRPSQDSLAIIFRDSGHIAIALPAALERSFPGLAAPYPFSHFPFGKFGEFAKLGPLLPAYLEKYFSPGEKYSIIHLSAIEATILRHAVNRLDRFYSLPEIEVAIAKLYERKPETAAFFGTSLDTLSILKLGPIILWAITFVLWRRVRRLRPVKMDSDEPWFALDVDDTLGKLVAYGIALFPIAASISVYILYAYAQELGLILAGRAISAQGLLNWEFPVALGPGWTPRDTWAATLLIFLPVHLCLLFWTTQRLVAIVNANSEKSVTATMLGAIATVKRRLSRLKKTSATGGYRLKRASDR